ncbi:hypothetical protein M0R45_016641 [Rubus argutus]|uniref:Secreted protein n=1 Tax=Rubus argutus TaxID=59490 RepID=A0AAW1XWQ5_RUBAR
MKQLIRCLSRVANLSQYCFLCSSDSAASSACPHRSESFRVLKQRRCCSSRLGCPRGTSTMRWSGSLSAPSFLNTSCSLSCSTSRLKSTTTSSATSSRFSATWWYSSAC